MIYTIGNAELYRRKLAKNLNLQKLGRRKGYAGGSVWETAKAAWAHIDANIPRLHGYSVFEVYADWKNTEPNCCGNPWNDLLDHAKIGQEIVRV